MRLKLFFLLVSFIHHIAALQVTGATTNLVSNGKRPVRLELGYFQTLDAKFSLFIQALQRFQATNQTDLVSYYSISGICKIVLELSFTLPFS